MAGDGATIKSRIRNLLLRSPSAKQRKSRESLGRQVTLEKVLGITASGNSGLTCDPRSGLVAYPAGCVVVLLNPKKKRQQHIINTSRKTITSLAFSPDGKYLVTGESGHLPAVRLWDVAERRQVAELQEHKYGVSCVAFSPDSKFIVSVGNQHDMMVNVWVWKKDVVVAANKVSSRVTGVSFSEDSSYFVTVGNRHVKFWYLDHCTASKASAPVPLLGRSGLLGELRNNFFCDVACGRGSTSDSTFCITSSGLLCEFNCERMLDKWVDLRTSAAQSLSLSEDTVFCGCADGTVRAFGSADLRFAGTLPRPHPLGCDVAAITEPGHLFSAKTDGRYPDAVAVTFDPVSQWLSCVYSDHSLYVWDVSDVDRVGKVHSALFHAACVGDLEMFPDVPGEFGAGLSTGAFLSCSADNTIRLWRADDGTRAPFRSHNVLSSDLLNVIYVDGNTGALQDPECLTNTGADKQGDGQTAESRSAIRTISVSPDGKHLASGDRSGTLRVHDLRSLEEILRVESHDAEILCLEFSRPETGVKLLATAGRDRLIHVLDAEEDYALLQTLDEHSASITAVRFAANDNKVRLISCGADKSIYFRTALKTERGTEFRRSHHTVRKSTPCDMDVDPTCKYAAVGCQDRYIRVFNISSGKQKKIYKGSLSEDGSLLRVQLDPSGQYVATSCSDKNISIFDFHTGECVATMDGHSEIVTGMKFTNDCKHLISVSGDSCIFVWRLAPELTARMGERLRELRQHPNAPPCRAAGLRREARAASSSDSDLEREEDGAEDDEDAAEDADRPEGTASDASSDSSRGEEDAATGGSDEGQNWELTKHASVSQDPPDSSKRPRRRWSHRMGPLELMVKSMLDLRQLETFAPKKSPREGRSTCSLPRPEERAARRRARPRADWTSSRPSGGGGGWGADVLYPEEGERHSASQRGGDYAVKEQRCRMRGSRSEGQESRSPDSACSLGYGSRDSSADRLPRGRADAESLSPGSSDQEPDEREEVTSMERALRTVTDAAGDDDGEEDLLRQSAETPNEGCSAAERSRVPRLSMSSRFLARGHNDRGMPVFAKVAVKEQCSRSAKPPVSKVRPLMEDNQSGNAADGFPVSPGRVEGPNRRDAADCAAAKKGKTTRTHLWRTSNPPPKAPLSKYHSVQNLSSESLHSSVTSVTSGDRRETRKRPQQLSLYHDTANPSFHFSSPSTGSSQSPDSPPPWESPKLRPHSYMNPTASSMAKSSRSASLADAAQPGSPPSSPLSPRDGRSPGEPEVEPAPLASLALSSRPAAAVSPPQGVPPSRIPLPRQQLSPRRSLCLEEVAASSGRPGSGQAGCSDPPVDAAAPAPGNRAAGRHRSLDASFPSSLPVRQKGDSLSDSAGAKECPLLPELTRASGGAAPNPSVAAVSPLPRRRACQPARLSPVPASAPGASHSEDVDPSITVETCRQAVTELRNSLKKTAMFYSTVLQSDRRLGEDQQEMRSILSEALVAVKAELDSLPHPARADPGVQGEGEKTRALLEQYAELLLRSVERRLESKT